VRINIQTVPLVDFLIMKLLVVLLLVAVVAAMPRKSKKPNRPKQEREDPGTIIRCMAENWKNGEPQIKACRDCFKAVGNPLSEEGLPKAKACVSQFLPMENEACATQIADLGVGEEEKGGAVIECFDETLEKENNDRCIKESKSTEVVGKLTDGSMCVMASHKYAFAYIKNVTKSNGGRGKGKGPRRGKGKGKKGKKMKGQMMKMLMKAHCGLASEGDDSKNTDCQNCFNAAVKLGKGKKQEMLSAITTCSEQHLTPKYDQCTNMLKDTTAEKKDTLQCYVRVLVNDLVVKCSAGVTEATADTLDSVMECGKEASVEWIKNNASPEVAEKIGNFLEDDDDDEDEDF